MASNEMTDTGDDRLTAAEPYRSANTFARVAMLFLAAYVLAALLSIVSSYMQIQLLERAVDDHTDIESITHDREPITEDEVTANDLREGVIAALMLVTFIGSVISFLFWIHRAYSNLPALGNPKGDLEYSTRWAVGGWFIPFVNLVIPYRVTREIWAKSDPTIKTYDDMRFSPPGSAPLILGWWLVWIISNVVGNLSYRFARDANTPSDFIFISKWNIVSSALNIISAMLAIMVISSINRRQELRSKQVAFDTPLPPAPPTFS